MISSLRTINSVHRQVINTCLMIKPIYMEVKFHNKKLLIDVAALKSKKLGMKELTRLADLGSLINPKTWSIMDYLHHHILQSL